MARLEWQTLASIEPQEWGLAEYLRLLGQLSPVAEIDLNQLEEMLLNENQEIWVLWDSGLNDSSHYSLGRARAIGSLYIMEKLGRGGSRVGAIEDIVVDSEARGQGLGRRVIEHLLERAQIWGCYKCLLSCSTEYQGFYEKCGLTAKDITMVKYYSD